MEERRGIIIKEGRDSKRAEKIVSVEVEIVREEGQDYRKW